jgi:hypothetical protein
MPGSVQRFFLISRQQTVVEGSECGYGSGLYDLREVSFCWSIFSSSVEQWSYPASLRIRSSLKLFEFLAKEEFPAR